MSDESFLRQLRGFATEYVESKRKSLQAGKPQTQVDGGGSSRSVSFSGQEISRDDLLKIKDIRESGGIITSAYDAKALVRFGTGVEVQTDNEDLKNWITENLPTLELLVLEMGEDATYYPYSVAEVVETRTGEFSHIEHIEPWTMLPKTDKFGDIIGWEQHLGGFGSTQSFDADEIGHIVLNKSSGRDKTGISDVLQNKEEIETFRSNQQAMREATARLGYPFVHAKAGREGAAQLNDNELRRIRNRLADIGPGETQVTGPDIDIETIESATVDFGAIQERDTRMLSNALGLPIEMLNEGSDGLGSGKPAEARLQLFALQNEAARRRFSDQFKREFLDDILAEYSPFNPESEEYSIHIKSFLDDKSDVAGLIQQVGDYMTANEARSKLDLAPIDDDDLGESYRTPAEEEAPAEENTGGLFGAESDTEDDTDFRDLAEIPEKYTDGTGLSESDFVPNSDIEDTVDTVLEFIDAHGLPNPEDQREGAARANQLKDHAANNDPLAPEFWQEISNFHARHRAQGNNVCDESTLPEKATEIDNSQFDKCYFDNGWFSDKTWGGDAGKEQADRIVAAIESTEGVSLSAGQEEWEHTMRELFDRVWSDDTDKELLEFSNSQVPEFVKTRLRETILSGDAVFSDIESLAGTDLMDFRTQLADGLTQDGWTLGDITGRIMDIDDGISREKAETVARTETAAAVNTAREQAYEETGMAEGEKFYWTGATQAEQPERTTDACDWLIQKTNPKHNGTPVSLSRLKELIAEAPTHDPDMDDNMARPENFTVHINERKTYTRAV